LEENERHKNTGGTGILAVERRDSGIIDQRAASPPISDNKRKRSLRAAK